MVVASRQVTLRDFLVFQMKLAVDGLKDLVVFQVSIVAMVVDFVSGRGKKPRWFYAVMRESQCFDRWLDLHGAMRRSGIETDAAVPDDGSLGAAAALRRAAAPPGPAAR
jgi:hypothetical protein